MAKVTLALAAVLATLACSADKPLTAPETPAGTAVSQVSAPSTPESGQAPLKMVGRYAYGRSYAVAASVKGGKPYVYLGSGAMLLVLDASNPGKPELVATIETPGVTKDLALLGSHLYIADERGGLRVVDVGDLLAPKEIASVSLAGSSDGVAVSGSLAFVASNDGEDGVLHVFDISAPGNPRESGSARMPRNRLRKLAASGRRVYVATSEAGLVVLDASNPRKPRRIGNLMLPGDPFPVAAMDRYVYTGLYSYPMEGSLAVIEVTAPRRPTLVSVRGLGGIPKGLTVSGRRLYIAGGMEVGVLDLSKPDSPTDVAWLEQRPGDPFRAWDAVAVADGTLYAADSWGGLSVISYQDRDKMTEEAHFATLGSSPAVAVSGPRAYLADAKALWVLVLSEMPTVPLLASYPVTSYSVVAGDNDLAVLGYWNQRVAELLDVSDVSAPRSLSRVEAAEGVRWMGVQGAFLYVLGTQQADGNLQVVDISNLARPTEVLSEPLPGVPVKGAVAGNRLYILRMNHYSTEYRLTVMDVSHPSAPRVVGEYAEPDAAFDFTLLGEHALVISPKGLDVIDVTNPGAMRRAGGLEGRYFRVAASGHWAYALSERGDRLVTIDLTIPEAPRIEGVTELPGTAIAGPGGVQVFASGGRIFASTTDAGLVIYDEPKN